MGTNLTTEELNAVIAFATKVQEAASAKGYGNEAREILDQTLFRFQNPLSIDALTYAEDTVPWNGGVGNRSRVVDLVAAAFDAGRVQEPAEVASK